MNKEHMPIGLTIYVKDRNDKKYRETYNGTVDSGRITEAELYKSLTEDLLNKYVSKGNSVRSVQRINNYDGTLTIKVFYTNDTKRKYIIEQ